MVNKIKLDAGNNYEPSESDEEYSVSDRKLLKKVRNSRKKDLDSEEEVFGFDDDDSGSEEEKDNDIEKFEHDSDIEDKEDDDIPDAKAWGLKKRDYYNTDFVDEDYDTYTAQEEQQAKLEEEEAREIQNRLAKELDDADFSLDFFKPAVSEEKEVKLGKSSTRLKTDLSDLSQRQKLQLFRKEAPEFEGLVDDFTKNVEECQEILEPALKFLKSKDLNAPLVDFIRTKYDLGISYCNNITFYLILKSKKIAIKNHPVVKRMVQIRQLLSELDEKYQEVVRPQLEKLLEHIQAGDEINFEEKETKSKKLGMLKNFEAENKALEMEEDKSEGEEDDVGAPDAKKARHDSEESDDEEEEAEEQIEEEQVEEGVEKRGITYQMSKNKGLTPHKKKEQRNVRVKNKQKYKKALIRRKGTIRDVKPKSMRYDGEVSGIKAFVKRSVKIK